MLIDGDNEKRGKRTRVKRKKKNKSSAQEAPTVQKGTTKRKKVPAEKSFKNPTLVKKRKVSRPWLMPLVVFILVFGVFILALLASHGK